MKPGYKVSSLIFLLLIFFTLTINAQSTYPFAWGFANGKIFLDDATQLEGQIKWVPHQNNKLLFRLNENAKIDKYAPGEITAFSVDNLVFKALFDLNVYSESYPLIGKTTGIKHTFGEVLSTGIFNIYYVAITGYNPVSGAAEIYPNVYFEKKANNGSVYAAYPLGIRMKDKKYEKAKENLYVFFKDYPDIIEQIKLYKQQDDFFKIVAAIAQKNTAD